MLKKTRVINPKYILERDKRFFLNPMCIMGFCQTYKRNYFYPKDTYERLSIRVCLKRIK
jgi:hypothetical protein